MPRRLILTRPEFASFLDDPRKIREFEKLFDLVTEHDSTIESINFDAGQALTTADLAVGLIAGIKELVELLSQAPRLEPVAEPVVEPPVVPYDAPGDTSPQPQPTPADDPLTPPNVPSECCEDVAPHADPVVLPEDVTPPVAVAAVSEDVTPPVAVIAISEDVTPPVAVVAVNEDVTPPATVVEACCDGAAPLPAPALIPDELWLAALAPAPVPAKRQRYGAFYSTNSQVIPALDTTYTIFATQTSLSHGVWQASGNQFYVDTEGVYNIQFSAQLSASQQSTVELWLRVNGNDVGWTNSVWEIQNANDVKIAAWNWLVPLRANDFFQLAWQAHNHIATITSYASGAGVNGPDVPGVIITVTECTGDIHHGSGS